MYIHAYIELDCLYAGVVITTCEIQKQFVWHLARSVHFPVTALTSKNKSQSNLLQRCYISTTACVRWSGERVERQLPFVW